jgi:hypothetical protein
MISAPPIAGARGANGIASAAPAPINVLRRKAVAINLFIETSFES